MFCVDRTNVALTWSGVIPGVRWTIRAAAPETIAADCEVPEPRKKRPPTWALGYAWSICEPGSRRPTIDLPGATKSGFRTPSPLLDHVGTESSFLVAVPLVSAAPTAIT